MRRVLVTGANKGVGLAIVEAILTRHADTFVYLGARNLERGREAAAGLVRDHAELESKIEVVELDVADDRSVANAVKRVEKLYGIVNNAGVGTTSGDFAAVVETNTLGVRRVCETFLPLLDPEAGRIVNVTSAAGPASFVSTCSPERQRFFLDAQMTWPRLSAFIDECLAMAGDKAAFAAKGLGDGSPYGFSKACANTYTLIVAREHPSLRVNACTPGLIATDMTLHYPEAERRTMKTPAEGATAPMHLLFGELEGNGRYYGSDAKRSPLDRYRPAGAPVYTGS